MKSIKLELLLIFCILIISHCLYNLIFCNLAIKVFNLTYLYFIYNKFILV